jgi:triosephosphate isomerase
MRKPLVAGNWKMFKNVAEARQLVADLIPSLAPLTSVERVLCPPFTSLLAVRALLEGTSIGLGAQNVHWEESGAYTGEIAPYMLAEFCQYVIIGHSERRAYFGETDETVNKKVKAAVSHGLVPIVCVGETLVENEAGETAQVVKRQIELGLEGISINDWSRLVVAYEPVWAIGTGKAATADGANQVIGEYIRSTLVKMLDENAASLIRILYGGSVKGSNAAEFFKKSDIDGALVGGASLKVSDFAQIVQAAG